MQIKHPPLHVAGSPPGFPAQCGLTALGTFAAALATHGLGQLCHGIWTMWIANGVVLGILQVTPIRRWPGFVAASLAGRVACTALLGHNVAATLPIALIGTFECVAAAWLMRGQIRPAFYPAPIWPMIHFLLTTGLIVPLGGGLLGALLPHPILGAQTTEAVFRLYAAGALGMVSVTPLALCILLTDMKTVFTPERRVHASIIVLIAVAVAVCTFVQTRYPLLFLIPPAMIAVAAWTGFSGVALMLPALAVLAVVCTCNDRGPFALNASVGIDERLVLILLFVAASFALGRYVANASTGLRLAMEALREEKQRLLDSQGRLAASEQRLRMLIDNVADHALYLLDPDGRVASWNAGAERINGYREAEVVGRHFGQFFTPGDRAMGEPERALTVARAQGRFETECWRMRKDGSRFQARMAVGAMRDASGALLGFATVVQDINSEARLRLLIDNVADHAMFLLDPNGNIISWNQGAERITRYASDDIAERGHELLFTGEDRARGEPARLLQTACWLGQASGEAWRVRGDGPSFWVRYTITAVRDDSGGLRGFAVVLQDLTGRKVEEAQRAVIIEAAPNGMMIVDETGIITLANAEADAIFGYPGGSLIRQPVETLVPPPLRGRLAQLRARLNADPNDLHPTERQFTAKCRDGSRVKIEVMLRPVRTPHGSIIVVSVFDITERRRRAAEREALEARERAAIAEANERLEKLTRHLARTRDHARQANEAKSRFLAGITHELRTPLNGILGYAQLLSMEGGLSPSQATRVEAMQSAGEHLLGMINAVLDLSQIESDRFEMHAIDIDLPALARACLDLVRPAARQKGLDLALAVAPATPVSLVTDPIRLRQVLVNLLGNAVKFTASGRVGLHLLPADSGEAVRIEVADTGPGISGAHREKLFREFERLQAEALSTVEGSGLGLAITARLVQRMGGRIGYDDNPCGGSVFWIELPRAAAAAAAEPAPEGEDRPPASAPPEAAPRSRRVLVVDDVAMNLDVAAAFLRHAGHVVTCVDNGAAAIEAVTAEAFDVVLMDVRMPGMDGLEATRRIRALPNDMARVPVVALTAQAFSDQIRQCREAGMNGHVAKPFQSATLLAAVEDALTTTTAPILAPVAPAPPPASAELAVVDLNTYHATAALLKPADAVKHLRALIARGESLLALLQARDPPASPVTVADAAHALGGAASTFGFRRVGDAARHYEYAVGTEAADVADRADTLFTSTTATLAALRELIGMTESAA